MIELSADLGEGSPRENEIWELVDAANVACGGHAGDESSMAFAVDQAARRGVILGAHPSYPDREHFGRISMAIDPAALEDSLVEQIGALRAIAKTREVTLARVKPHGALYNEAHRDRALAGRIVRAMQRVDRGLALVADEHSAMADAARAAGVPLIREAFADRRYRADGSLVARGETGALLTVDQALAQATMLAAAGFVAAADGTRVRIAFDTLCVHADMEQAVERLRAIRERLRD